MAIGLIGRKIGMTQVFGENGVVISVTAVQLGPCMVLQKKTTDKDGYNSVQLGLIGKSPRRLRNKPVQGHLNKSKAGNVAYIKEIRGTEMQEYEVGQTVPLDILAENDTVHVTGISKGKGFQGTMKRHAFSGMSSSHGTHKTHRAPGAIGQCAWPSRTFKGMKMPGRMGGVRTTTKNLKVVRVIPEKNLVLIRGSVPGAVNGTILVTKKS